MRGSSYQKVIDLTVRKGGIEMIRKFFEFYCLDENISSDFYVRHLKDYFPEEISFLIDRLDGGDI